MKEFKLDKLDHQIIEILEEDCSLAYSDIANKIDANMWTVRDRIELLKKRGIIEKCKAVVNYSKMGYGCEALLFLNVNPSRVNEFISFLRGEKRVKAVTIMTGQERIMVTLIDDNCLQVREFIQEELMRFDIELKEFNVILEKPIK
ncbi:MAG: Lrp/AsnC family transcriptional regulator [Thermoplasmata archaeon]